jgi:bla regulator protein blaR1
MTDWVFDTGLVTTLLLAAVLILRGSVARTFGPTVAYALWLLPAARFVMPSLHIEQAAQNMQGAEHVIQAKFLGAAFEGAKATTQAATADTGPDWGLIALLVWLGIAALMFVVQMARYVAMRDELLSDALHLGAVRGITLIQSDRVKGPLAFGLLRRYIVVPENFATDYSPRERELAMQHEVAHHVSGDLFANLVGFILLCLMWFNPLAWISWRAFRFDQEAACDARVLAGKAPEDRHVYGRALARAAHDGLPTFATALNAPRTIIERLRRLTMNDVSKNRRLLGKLGVLAAVGVVLPLTATIVPVAAQDETAAKMVANKPVKVVKISLGTVVDGKAQGAIVKTISRNGTAYIFHSDKALSEAQANKLIDEAEASQVEADADVEGNTRTQGDIEADRGEDEAEKGEAEAERANAEAEGMAMATAVATATVDGKYVAAMIPDIDISEVTTHCKNGEPVTTDASGFDGKRKARIRIVMCGKGQAKIARAAAIDGLKEALDEIRSDKDIPDSVRRQVMDSLNGQIAKMKDEDS